MTVVPSGSAAAPLPSPLEAEVIAKLRTRLRRVMVDGIPPDLDTDFNLLRWIRGHNGDVKAAMTHFRNYSASREAAGFVGNDLFERLQWIIIYGLYDLSLHTRSPVSLYLPHLGHCTLNDSVWSADHNAFLFVERAWSQPKELIKSMKTSDYLLHCFAFSEVLLQLILKREKCQSLGKGPVQVIVIFDLSLINITDYLNPVSGYLKLWQLRAEMWQYWYPDIIQRIFVVNPPRMSGILWKLARLFLNERSCRLFEVMPAGKEGVRELLKQLPKAFVPQDFGGDFVYTGADGDSAGCSLRKKITTADHYKSLQHYKRKGVRRARPTHKELLPAESFHIPIFLLEGQSLCWDFLSSGELDFHVYTNDDEFDMVYPLLRLATSKLPEEGTLENLVTGEYVLRFSNPSQLFTVQLDYSITLVGEGRYSFD
ncbi:hypothetical protein PENTCL1PPCAC_9900 [Pristionchus entomophagus]|uniref:CRAL-TRIO domain-containing protein n=1 Tax=Pristionchus entomophagus TaxID=358040 RepID=A0AAV5SX57_9BILA|nr:hypothetical protein PENTCL1PPCAC_9900 [Pristionchus entomophagus]